MLLTPARCARHDLARREHRQTAVRPFVSCEPCPNLVKGASGLLHLAPRATDQLLDRGDDPVGGGVVQHMAEAGKHLHSSARHRGGEPHRVVPWRDYSVAIADDDDNRSSERVIALGLPLEERLSPAISAAFASSVAGRSSSRAAERFM